MTSYPPVPDHRPHVAWACAHVIRWHRLPHGCEERPSRSLPAAWPPGSHQPIKHDGSCLTPNQTPRVYLVSNLINQSNTTVHISCPIKHDGPRLQCFVSVTPRHHKHPTRTAISTDDIIASTVLDYCCTAAVGSTLRGVRYLRVELVREVSNGLVQLLAGGHSVRQIFLEGGLPHRTRRAKSIS